jgi:hypothetical protein
LIDQSPLSYTQLPHSLDLATLLLQNPNPCPTLINPNSKSHTLEFFLLDIERMVQIVLMDTRCSEVEEAGGDGNA